MMARCRVSWNSGGNFDLFLGMIPKCDCRLAFNHCTKCKLKKLFPTFLPLSARAQLVYLGSLQTVACQFSGHYSSSNCRQISRSTDYTALYIQNGQRPRNVISCASTITFLLERNGLKYILKQRHSKTI